MSASKPETKIIGFITISIKRKFRKNLSQKKLLSRKITQRKEKK
jgi:hypothetical protein